MKRKLFEILDDNLIVQIIGGQSHIVLFFVIGCRFVAEGQWEGTHGGPPSKRQPLEFFVIEVEQF